MPISTYAVIRPEDDTYGVANERNYWDTATNLLFQEVKGEVVTPYFILRPLLGDPIEPLSTINSAKISYTPSSTWDAVAVNVGLHPAKMSHSLAPRWRDIDDFGPEWTAGADLDQRLTVLTDADVDLATTTNHLWTVTFDGMRNDPTAPTASLALGQRFKATSGGSIGKVIFWGSALGSAPASPNITCEIWNDVGGAPSVLLGTSEPLDWWAQGASYRDRVFLFTTQPTVALNFSYHAQLKATYDLSASNYISIRGDYARDPNGFAYYYGTGRGVDRQNYPTTQMLSFYLVTHGQQANFTLAANHSGFGVPIEAPEDIKQAFQIVIDEAGYYAGAGICFKTSRNSGSAYTKWIAGAQHATYQELRAVIDWTPPPASVRPARPTFMPPGARGMRGGYYPPGGRRIDGRLHLPR